MYVFRGAQLSFRKIFGISGASGPFPIVVGPVSAAFGPFRWLADQFGTVSDSLRPIRCNFRHSRAISESILATGRIIASEA